MVGVSHGFGSCYILQVDCFVATVRCGKTLVIHDNRVRRRYIKVLLFVCLTCNHLKSQPPTQCALFLFSTYNFQHALVPSKNYSFIGLCY